MVHQMHSKWLDFGTEAAAFHYQSVRYNNCKPPAFGSFRPPRDVASVATNTISRERLRTEEMTKEELLEQLDSLTVDNNTTTSPTRRSSSNQLRKRISRVFRPSKDKERKKERPKVIDDYSVDQTGGFNDNNNPKRQQKHQKLRQLDDEYFDESGKPYPSFQTEARKRLHEGLCDSKSPPLFLEEVAHLLSLLSAVAVSTLRNDLEDAESPLIEFVPNAPWPCVDPDAYDADIRQGWESSSKHISTVFRFLFGMSRTDKSRTLYNAARPFRVIGNVSDAEIELLQAARGPQAKVSLCSMWLQEFISREYMAGSTGNVAPPIISRLYQFVSDGMVAYNQARKIAYIPFPFPHAQIT